MLSVSTPTIAIYYYYSARKLILYSFYRPTEGRRLSRPSWLVTYRDGLLVHSSPILVLTGSDVAQLRWSCLTSVTSRANIGRYASTLALRQSPTMAVGQHHVHTGESIPVQKRNSPQGGQVHYTDVSVRHQNDCGRSSVLKDFWADLALLLGDLHGSQRKLNQGCIRRQDSVIRATESWLLSG